jgi:hemin uptake protein HemP
MVTSPFQMPVPSAADSQEPGPVRVVPVRSMVRSSVACISSESLLAGANEVQIEHRGALYRLKQTSLGKLILTK